MLKKALLILTFCIVALTATSLFVWKLLSPPNPPKYEISIVRNFHSQEEENALNAAESVNYSTIVNAERFDGSESPEAYLHPGTYLAYTYANFIDKTAIDYYETRYYNLQGKEDPEQIELTYIANVTKQSECRIFNSPAPEDATWHNITMVISAADGSVTCKDSANIKLFYRNQSSYQTIEWGYDLNFSDCYVVDMKLTYSEIYAPTAAFFSDVSQILILDREFVPLLIGVESGKAIA